MSDFLVWPSPIQVPDSISHKWKWTRDRRVAIRRRPFRGLDRWRGDSAQVIVIGHCRGRRPRTDAASWSSVARQIRRSLAARGPTGLDRHLGPLAGVYIEEKGRRAIIWRDRFGRHPVQMVRLPTGWVVTTCPQEIAELSRGNIRWSSIAEFIHGTASQSDADVFDDVFRIRPGEAICFENGAIVDRCRWWTPSLGTVDRPVEKTRSLLHDIGTYYGRKPHILALSAGLDSATLAAFVSQHHARSEATTFEIPGDRGDERLPARQIADHLGLRWKKFSIERHWPLSRSDDHRFPVARGPSGYPDSAWKMPWYRWLRRRRPRLPVIFGNGADEALWIPPRLWLEDRWNCRDWTTLLEAFKHLPPSRWIRPAATTAVNALGLRSIRRAFGKPPRSGHRWERPEHWIGELDTRRRLPSHQPPQRRFRHLRIWRLWSWRWERVMRFLAFEARRFDRPVWTPFLDARFWELSLSLRPEDLVEGGRQKAILRQATAGILPEGDRRRRKVGGFDSIVERGLADRGSHRVYELFARPRLARWDAFEPDRFLDAYDAYRRAPRASAQRVRGSWAIWRTVATELWLRHRESRRSKGGF